MHGNIQRGLFHPKASHNGRNLEASNNGRNPLRTKRRTKSPRMISNITGSKLHPVESPPQIYNDIKGPNMISLPVTYSTQMGRNGSAYCEFHKITCHNTDDCYTLKQQIDDLIPKGELKKYVQQERGNAKATNVEKKSRSRSPARRHTTRDTTWGKSDSPQHENPTKGSLNTIVEGFT